MEFLDSISELCRSLDSLHGTVEEIKTELSVLKPETVVTWTWAKETEDCCGLITQSMESTMEKLDYIENHSRRGNLRFEGIAETSQEDWNLTEKKVADFIVEKLTLLCPNIERAHRLGKLPSFSLSHKTISPNPEQL